MTWLERRHEWTDDAQEELDYYLAALGNDHPLPPPHQRGDLHPEDVLWGWLKLLRDAAVQHGFPPFK
jgi:hypothetical protein